MGYGKLRRVSTLTKNIPPTSPTSDVQQQQMNTASSIETGVLPLVRSLSRSNLPAELKRRSSSHRRSIYSIDFDIDELTKQDHTTTNINNTADRTTPSDKPPPPSDGGYGWVVVVAVHIIQALSIGFLTSLGIFYIEWQEYFDVSATQAGLSVSLSSVVFGITTPLAVGITGMVGSRPLVMSGTLVVFAGLLGTSYATSITQLTFTVGVITAFGYGMISGPSVLSIGDYFDEKFALANGIAFAGVSIGQLTFPPMCVEFIYWFGGWRGAMFVISALTLNMAVCGALLRPLNNVKSKVQSRSKRGASTIMTTTPTNTSIRTSDFENGLSYDYSSASTSSYHNDIHYEKQFREVATSTSFENHQFDSNAIVNSNTSSTTNKRYIKKSISFARPETVTTCSSDSLDDSVFDDLVDDSPIMFTASTVNQTIDQSTSNIQTVCAEFNNPSCGESDGNGSNPDAYPKLAPDIIKSPILPNELPILNVCDPSVHSNEDATITSMTDTRTKENVFWEKFKDIATKIVYFLGKCYGIPGVFLSPLCVMMMPAILCLGIGWYATIMYQAARAVSVGISETDASFLLSLMGIGSLVGRVGHGWFVDKGFITNEILLVLCLGTCSASTFIICFTSFYPIIAILATIQGMSSGIANTVAVVVIRTFAKPNYEESAMGMLYLIWGIGDLIGGVVGGYLYDATGDYNVAFYFAGSAFAFTTIVFYVTCVLKDRIILKLYHQFQLEKTENSTDKLDEMNVTTINEHDEYDNPAFKMDDEDSVLKEEQLTSHINDAGNVFAGKLSHVPYHIGLDDDWRKPSHLQDTSV